MAALSKSRRALCALDSIAEVGARGITLRDAGRETPVFVVRFAGEVRAYRNSCPHTGISLNWLPDQFFDAECRLLQCSMHGALFQPLTGECVHGPCVGDRLERLPVEIREGLVYLAPDAVDDAGPAER